MNILWFTWKDHTHPQAGGAEVLNEQHYASIVHAGHQLTLIVGGYPGAKRVEKMRGYTIIRVGNKYTLAAAAWWYYRRNLRGWEDIVIEEINTAPFMTQWYTSSKRRFLYIYQLAREIWWHEIIWPIGLIGYLLEPIYLYHLRRNMVFTESESTKADLVQYGFRPDNIMIVPPGLKRSTSHTSKMTSKYRHPTVLSLGSIRSMKRTLEQIQAYEIARDKIPTLRMKIAGSPNGSYGQRVINYIEHSRYGADIEYLGRVSTAVKHELMSRSHIILVTSLKEGWGLIVTEAGRVGTPAIVYDVDGLRDSVVHDMTGLITSMNTPSSMAQSIISLINDKKHYKMIQKNTLKHNAQYTVARANRIFIKRLIT